MHEEEHMETLERFVEAQSSDHAGIETALNELRSGRKRSHWIWYVFPQLVDLGQSPMARRYGLRDAQEAADYLRHPALGAGLVGATEVVAGQLDAGIPLLTLMGSEIDALKVVSSLTLFEAVACWQDGPDRES